MAWDVSYGEIQRGWKWEDVWSVSSCPLTWAGSISIIIDLSECRGGSCNSECSCACSFFSHETCRLHNWEGTRQHRIGPRGTHVGLYSIFLGARARCFMEGNICILSLIGREVGVLRCVVSPQHTPWEPIYYCFLYSN